ncbi:hypothetical protein [Woodsholea maritima]|uniref:hypothetical protein n=1 Tax=Woodsholea maritima TaxID=240237 RepID=UPI00037CBD71|nr:hypothetical protein [Woodsholea maritima]
MAFFKGSFYETTPLFEADEDGILIFKGIRARRRDTPDPILEHSIEAGTRLDALAQHYYADTRAWRRIADANPDILFAEDLIYHRAPEDNERLERLGELRLIPARRDAKRGGI